MKTKSIKEYLTCINENDYTKITELKIDRLSIDKEIQEVDLNEIGIFPNIEKLSLFNLTMTYDDFQILKNLKKLNYLKLINCDIVDIIEDELNIDNLYLDNTYIDISNLHGIDTIIVRNTTISINHINCNLLDISGANITNIDEINANQIVVSENQYEQYKDKILNLKINIKDKYDSIVGEIL